MTNTENTTPDTPNMVEQLDKVRNIVHSLGYLDEGYFDQAAEIVGNLSIEVHKLVQACFAKFPELKEKADNGDI